MRVDKFLWALRYFKTRNQAATACKKGQVKVNEQQAKPGKEVYTDDKINIRKSQINYSLSRE
jgi:ribosome-associated heat shock protein Hsp15